MQEEMGQTEREKKDKMAGEGAPVYVGAIGRTRTVNYFIFLPISAFPFFTAAETAAISANSDAPVRPANKDGNIM